MSWLIDLAGLQLLTCSLGIALTVVLLDSAPGFVRDHPPFSWRAAGTICGPLSFIAFICLFFGGEPFWVSMALALPFALMNLWYSWAWLRRYSAGPRRQRGYEALILGLIAVLFTSLAQTADDSGSALVMAAFAGSTALMGGLGTLALTFLIGGKGEEVTVAPSPFGVPARVVASGLGITVMALIDGGLRLLSGEQALASFPYLCWIAFSLLVPLGLVAAGHKLFPRWQAPIWASAFSSVLVGQVALQTILFLG